MLPKVNIEGHARYDVTITVAAMLTGEREGKYYQGCHLMHDEWVPIDQRQYCNIVNKYLI